MRELRREVQVNHLIRTAGSAERVSYWVQVQPRGGLRFSAEEVRQILVAVGAMTLAFALALVGGIAGARNLGSPAGLGILLAVSLVAVVTAFLLHELAHKVVAQRYGCFAEFRYSLMGLGIGILTAAFGFLFAMPGAVVISGHVDARQTVRISAAGPGTNLAIAGTTTAVAVLLGVSTFAFADIVSVLVGTVAFVNLFLGIFNLLPFLPLDGFKIFSFNKPLWGGMLVLAVALYFVGNSLGVFPSFF